MSKEKRRQPRLDANLFAEISSASGKSLGRAVVTDVSLSGMAIETEVDLSEKDQISCHVEIPLTLEFTVVRAIVKGQVKRYGLRIKNQSLFDKIMLKKILIKGRRRTGKVSL